MNYYTLNMGRGWLMIWRKGVDGQREMWDCNQKRWCVITTQMEPYLENSKRVTEDEAKGIMFLGAL